MPEIPERFLDAYPERSTTPLGADALVRQQTFGLGPGGGLDLSIVVTVDGRCFVAHGGPVPDEPTTTLEAADVDRIRDSLDTTDFFALEPFQEAAARDGSLTILAARDGSRSNEVWFLRTGNETTDLLRDIASASGEQQSWADLLREQQDLQRRLEES